MFQSKNQNLLNFFSAKTHLPILKTVNQIGKEKKPIDRSRIEKMLAGKLAKRQQRESSQVPALQQLMTDASAVQSSSTTPKKKGVPQTVPAVILSMSGVSRLPQGHGTSKKYSISLKYLDHQGGKHNKTVFFGSWGKEYYAEHEEQEMDSLRFASLQRLKYEDNPLHKDFYISRILARKGVNNIDAACIHTCKEIVQQH
jgi:hypothetical protein